MSRLDSMRWRSGKQINKRVRKWKQYNKRVLLSAPKHGRFRKANEPIKKLPIPKEVLKAIYSSKALDKQFRHIVG